MANILANEPLADQFYLMRVQADNSARMGQFYMLRAWERYPVLSRPISVFDRDQNTLAFLYKAVGQGTRILAGLKAGEEIALQGPYGNGWPSPEGLGSVALVGGGVGIAPLYLAAREMKAANPGCRVRLHLGFSGQPVLEEAYRQVADQVTVKVGGFVTDDVDPQGHDRILACGPQPMMEALYQKCRAAGAAERLYVSLEERMACGVGACLVCSCRTRSGNKKACKDGPVFRAEEVFGL